MTCQICKGTGTEDYSFFAMTPCVCTMAGKPEPIITGEAKAERMAIVKYLRETAEIHRKRAKAGDKPLVSQHHADACTWAAEVIAVGGHWGDISA